LGIFSVVGCALTVSYDDYERSNKATSDAGGSIGIGGGGTFGGSGGSADSGSDASGGSAGAGAGGVAGGGGEPCTTDEVCGTDTVCQDFYCDGTSCQVTNLTNDNCAPATCTGVTESAASYCDDGQCVQSSAVSCLPFKCGSGGVCLTTCNGVDECGPSTNCTNGGCVPCVSCSTKLSNPALLEPLCEPQSYDVAYALIACCTQNCVVACGGPAPFTVCGGTDPSINGTCLSCLSEDPCKAELVLCQND
jgi:hypothetical protein